MGAETGAGPAVEKGDYRFPKEERLKRRRDIDAVFRKGRKAACAGATLFYKANALAINRVAFTFSRKFGNAVERNRARRLGREAYRHLRGRFRRGWDVVLLVYPGEGATARTRARQLKTLCERAGLLEGRDAAARDARKRDGHAGAD